MRMRRMRGRRINRVNVPDEIWDAACEVGRGGAAVVEGESREVREFEEQIRLGPLRSGAKGASGRMSLYHQPADYSFGTILERHAGGLSF